MSDAAPPIPVPAAPRPRYFWRWLLATLLVLVLLALLTLIAMVYLSAQRLGGLMGVQRSESAVMEILRSEDMNFLVTDRLVTRIDVEVNEDSLWAGGRQAILLATAKVYVGIDLKQLSSKSIHEEKDAFVVEVPRPSVLDISVQPDDRYFDKKTGMWALSDWWESRDVEKELRSRLRVRALEFVRSEKMMPDPNVELDRLNRYAAFLTPRVGKRVEFRYAK